MSNPKVISSYMPGEMICGLFNALVSLCMKCLLERALVVTLSNTADIIYCLKFPPIPSNGDIIAVYTGATTRHRNKTELSARCSRADPVQLYLVIKISEVSYSKLPSV